MCENRMSLRQMAAIVALLGSCPAVPAAQFAGRTGTLDDPYRIATAEHLRSIDSALGYRNPALGPRLPHFVLVNDIDLDPNLPGGRVFDRAVIAADEISRLLFFGGSFDGGGHAIRNLVIRVSSPSNRSATAAGLFAQIGGGGGWAVVKNLRVEAADVETLDGRGGILAGENYGRVVNCEVSGRISASLETVTPFGQVVGGLVCRNMGEIIDCRADTDFVRGRRIVGGLAASNSSRGIIKGCSARSDQVYAFKGEAGGLVAFNEGIIVGSCAMGEILAEDSSRVHGGLVGANAGTILECYSRSDIEAGIQCSNLGGFAGNNRGTIVNCYAGGSIRTQDRCDTIGGLVGLNFSWVGTYGLVVNSYAAGTISTGTNNTYIGGLVGTNRDADVKMSFWDVEATGVAVSAAGAGLTTEQMQRADTFLEAGWHFSDVWKICEGKDYPRLRWEGVSCR